MNAEVDIQGQKYILNDAAWYVIDSDFVSQTNAFFKSIVESTIQLPLYGTMNEPRYNVHVASEDDGIDLMDRKMISIGGGRSSVEFCDLFTKDRRLVHVKKYGASSVLSHLFQQGVVSGELFLSDVDFRKKVNEELSAGFKFDDEEKRPEASSYEVCFAIMSDVPGNLNIPFFSKVVMRNAAKRLQTFGYTVTKKKIARF